MVELGTGSPVWTVDQLVKFLSDQRVAVLEVGIELENVDQTDQNQSVDVPDYAGSPLAEEGVDNPEERV